MTIPWQDQPYETAVPIPVIIQEPLPPGFHRIETPPLVTGYGFTVSRVAGDNFSAVAFLSEDPLRTAVKVLCSAVVYLGSKKQMLGQGQMATNGTNGPGMRIPAASSSMFVINSTDEIWIGFTGTVEVSAWVERRVPGGTI